MTPITVKTLRTSLAAFAVAASVALTGCSMELASDKGDQPAPAQTPASTTENQPEVSNSSEDQVQPREDSASTSTSNSETDNADSESGSGTSAQPVTTGPALAQADVPVAIDGDKKATMTVAITDFSRNGDLVEATYSFTLHTSANTTTDVQKANDRSLFDPYAVDTKNLNKHSLVYDVSSNGSEISLRPEIPATGVFVFGAPPKDVTSMDVQLWEGIPLAKGVKIK